MSTRSTVSGVIALLAGLAGPMGCQHAAPSMGAAPPTEFNIPDQTLMNGIADRGQMIRETEQPTSSEGLFAQLDRESIEIDLSSAVTQGNSLRASEVYDLRMPSVLVIATIRTCDDPKCQWPGHSIVSSCATAFAIGPDGACVTNYHVFEDPGKDEFMVVSTAKGVVYPVVEVLAANKADDIAIFRVDTRGDRFEPVPLRAGAPIGTPVAVISHPERHFYMMTTGSIARRSVRRGDLSGGGHRSRRAPPKSTPPELPIEPPDPERVTHALEVTAEYALGSSGGPVLDDLGNAVGMVCATDTLYAEPDKKEDPQAVVRTCVPVESILRLIKRPQKP